MLTSFCTRRGQREEKREKGRKVNSERGRKGYVKGMGMAEGKRM